VLGALITIAIVVAVVTIAIYSTQQAAQRATLEKVRLGIEEVQLQEATSTSIDVNVRLVMVNPNRDAVAFDRMTFDLYGNGSLVGNTEYGQKLDVPPFSSTFIVVPMGISWSGGNEALSSSMIQGNMTWEVKGTAYFDTSWGTVSVPVDVTSP
jgi:LEA14-like dessication related protein